MVMATVVKKALIVKVIRMKEFLQIRQKWVSATKTTLQSSGGTGIDSHAFRLQRCTVVAHLCGGCVQPSTTRGVSPLASLPSALGSTIADIRNTSRTHSVPSSLHSRVAVEML